MRAVRGEAPEGAAGAPRRWLFGLLPEHPVLTVNGAIDLLGCSRRAALKAVGVLEDAGIVRKLGERQRNRVVTCHDDLTPLREGTELGE